MSDTHGAQEEHDEPARYEIRLKGHLDDRWTDHFDGLTLTREDNGTPLLTGPWSIRPRCMGCYEGPRLGTAIGLGHSG